MYKVDTKQVRFDQPSPYLSERPDFHITPATRFPYRREPYARGRVRLESGGFEIVDAKGISQTNGHILLSWADDDLRTYSVWVHKESARPIQRDASRYRDPYDL
ncbi:hypothetical protein ACX80B_09945 [Arthrobacter monumenti]